MMRIICILSTFFMISCYSLLSDFEENEQLLSYDYYLNHGWIAFESINLYDSIAIDAHSDYYQSALEMFNNSVLAINDEFGAQNFIGPYYKSYNGLGWNNLYYAGEFLNSENSDIRDSLRVESKIYFDLALIDLSNSLFEDILDQDWCNTYLGLSYTHYNLGLTNSVNLDSSLQFSENLLNLKSAYDFGHDQLNYKNVHYLRGKIFLHKEMYVEAYYEIQYAIESCNAMIDDEIDINLLLQCFDAFANGND